MNKKKPKLIFVRVYGILDKKLNKIIRVSLDEDDIKLDLDLDNHDGKLILCKFDFNVEIPI